MRGGLSGRNPRNIVTKRFHESYSLIVIRVLEADLIGFKLIMESVGHPKLAYYMRNVEVLCFRLPGRRKRLSDCQSLIQRMEEYLDGCCNDTAPACRSCGEVELAIREKLYNGRRNGG